VGHDERALHIAHRIKAYEAFVMELRWRVRLLRNGDDEDRRYHGILNERELVEWVERKLVELEEADKKYAREKHKVFVGRL
jgi:hypothetical protein